MAINYFTKWIEVKPLSSITEKKTTDFIWRNVICRYGIPHALITDNEKHFDNQMFKEFRKGMEIELKFCKPAHS